MPFSVSLQVITLQICCTSWLGSLEWSCSEYYLSTVLKSILNVHIFFFRIDEVAWWVWSYNFGPHETALSQLTMITPKLEVKVNALQSNELNALRNTFYPEYKYSWISLIRTPKGHQKGHVLEMSLWWHHVLDPTDMFWYWYQWLIVSMFVLPATGNGTYHKLSTSVPRSVHNKGVKFVGICSQGLRVFVSVVRIREGAYYRGFCRGNVWGFWRYIGNCPYWRGVRTESFDCIYIFLYYLFTSWA